MRNSSSLLLDETNSSQIPLQDKEAPLSRLNHDSRVPLPFLDRKLNLVLGKESLLHLLLGKEQVDLLKRLPTRLTSNISQIEPPLLMEGNMRTSGHMK